MKTIRMSVYLLLLPFLNAYSSGYVKVQSADFLLGDRAEISLKDFFAPRYDNQAKGFIQAPLSYREGYQGEGRLSIYLLVYQNIKDADPIEEYRVILYGNDYLEFNVAGKYHDVRYNNTKVYPCGSNELSIGAWIGGIISNGISLINGNSSVKTD